MNRRGFFAAVLAPLVVTFKPPPVWGGFWPVAWVGQKQMLDLQRKANALYNERLDNIYLSLR